MILNAKLVLGIFVVIFFSGCLNKKCSNSEDQFSRISVEEAKELAVGFLTNRFGKEYIIKDTRRGVPYWLIGLTGKSPESRTVDIVFSVRIRDDGSLANMTASVEEDRSEEYDIDVMQSAVGLELPIDNEDKAIKATIDLVALKYPDIICEVKAIYRMKPGWDVVLSPKVERSVISTEVVIHVDDDGQIIPPVGVYDSDKDQIWLKVFPKGG